MNRNAARSRMALRRANADPLCIHRTPHHDRSTLYGTLSPQASQDDCQSLAWTPHLRELLVGTRDLQSPLNLLRGHEDTILRLIYSWLWDLWITAVTLTPPSEMVGRMLDYERVTHQTDHQDNHGGELDTNSNRTPLRSLLFFSSSYSPAMRELGSLVSDRPQVAFSTCGTVEFPEPANRNVNMMPFVMGYKDSLPADLRPFYDDAIARCPVGEKESGRICYLTVMEGWVEPETTQRRGGLHTEAPGVVRHEFTKGSSDCGMVHGVGGRFVAGHEHHWGGGVALANDEFEGGLYIASSVGGTTKVWNALIDTSSGVVDRYGGIEHLRPLLQGRSRTLKANELVWMTDRTPHEALPLQRRVYRQFFRLVTSQVTLWYKDHSTPNPRIPRLPAYVTVIEGSKF